MLLINVWREILECVVFSCLNKQLQQLQELTMSQLVLQIALIAILCSFFLVIRNIIWFSFLVYTCLIHCLLLDFSVHVQESILEHRQNDTPENGVVLNFVVPTELWIVAAYFLYSSNRSILVIWTLVIMKNVNIAVYCYFPLCKVVIP